MQVLGFERGEIQLQVQCSKGTYVRTLAEDIGRALGSCAYVTELQRLSIGPYKTGMLSMAEVEAAAEQGFGQLDALLLPIDSGVQQWPVVQLDDDSAYYLKLGQAVQVAQALRAEGEISDTFYVILSGKLKIMKGDEEIALIGDGECFGEMAYIAGQARFATVVADTDCILMEITPTFMERLSTSIQFLFFKNFAMTLVRRLSKDSRTATNS